MVEFLKAKETVLAKSKINLGCGNNTEEGWINIDMSPTIPNIDICMDLETEKLPIPDNSIDEIKAIHVLEHISNLKLVLTECSRVLKPGGEFTIIVPAYSSLGSFQDPTHVRFFTDNTFKYYLTGLRFKYYFNEVNFKLKRLRKKRTKMYLKFLKICYPFVKLIGKRRFDMFVDSFFMHTILQYEAIMVKVNPNSV